MKKLGLSIIICILLTCSVFAEETVSDKEFNQAIKQGNVEFVKQNISQIYNIDSGYCFLCTAAEKKQDEILDILLENNANPDCPASTISPLYTALVHDNNYAVEKLLDAGADPNNNKNLPLIYLAIASNNADAVKSLLEAGADYSNVTFMKVKALTLAFSGRHPEIEDVFINYWNSRFETPATDINTALELLKNSEAGNKYYEILNGNNPTGNPYKILFCDIDKISQGKLQGNSSKRYNPLIKQKYLYIDNKYRTIQPEVLAVLLAGESIDVDDKNSVIEQLVKFGAMGNVWQEIISKNPEINDTNNPTIKGFNGIINILNANTDRFTAGDYNNLWVLSGLASTKNLTSKGFKNKDLNSYFK